jgi:hypothetical protein
LSFSVTTVLYLTSQNKFIMFKYNNREKNASAKRIMEKLKQTYNIIISEQSAGRIEYLIRQRQFLIDSVEVAGKEASSGKPIQLLVNISLLVQIINP